MPGLQLREPRSHRWRLAIFVAAALITAVSAVTLFFVEQRLLTIPMGLCPGLRAGRQTLPAVLAFASEQTCNDRPNIGYATVYPLATIAGIILARAPVALLR
ncbi:MAG: hypothetical protein ACUVS4_09240 [Chloroflexaceae bacterium]